MAYFSLNEDFQGLGSFGCGEKCRCVPCAQRQAGRASSAEWYKRDEEEQEPPAGPQPPRANNRPAIGEPPPQGPPLVLQPTRLFQDDPTPPLVRRMRGVMSGGLTPPTLRTPFQPTPPPRPPDLFRLSPEFQRKLIESASGNRRYALAVLALRKGEPEWKTRAFLNGFVKDVDELVKENNP